VSGVTEDLDLLLAAAREAGEAALGYFGKRPRTWPKGKSIVSEADLAVDRLLTDRLRPARPDYGWLSEETADHPDRLDRRRVFVVDPIDGTRDFLDGGDEWTVALAVVEDGRPIVGVVFAPVRTEIYAAALGAGSRCNGKAIHVSAVADLRESRFAASGRYGRHTARAVGFEETAVRFVPSLAYRFTMVAAARLDFAVSAPGSHDWDLAAADLLVKEAGGAVNDLAGRPLRYNGQNPRHPAIVASNAALRPSVTALVAEVDRRLN